MSRPKRLDIDEKRLRELWPQMSQNKIARILGCSDCLVMKRAAELGLPRKSKDWGQPKVRRRARSRAGEYRAPQPGVRQRIPPKTVPGVTMAQLMAGR